MCLHAGSMHRINSMWAKDAVVPGAGPVVKNTAVRTTTPPQDNACRRQKTITILFVAVKRLGSKRKSIVEEGILGTVHGDGLLNFDFIW